MNGYSPQARVLPFGTNSDSWIRPGTYTSAVPASSTGRIQTVLPTPRSPRNPTSHAAATYPMMYPPEAICQKNPELPELNPSP